MAVSDSNNPIPQPTRFPGENGCSTPRSSAPNPTGIVDGSAEGAPLASAPEPSGAALFQAVRRRWVPGVCLGLLGACLAVAVTWFISPPKYQAQALLHVASRTPKGVFGAENGYETSEEFTAYKGTQTTILKSRPVLEAVLRQPQFASISEAHQQDDPVEWLDKNLQVDTLLGPEILRVTFTSESPDQAATILNAIVESYLKEVARREQEKRQARMDQLQVSVRNYEEILRQKRNTLRELQDSLGVDDTQTLTLRFQNALAQEATARQKLIDTRMDVKKTQLDLAALKELGPPNVTVPEAAVTEYLRQDPQAQRQLTLLSQIDEEIQKIRNTVAPPFQPSLLAAPEKRRTLATEALESRRREVRPYLEGNLRTKQEADTKEKIRQLDSHLKAAREQVAALEAEVKQQEERVKRLSSAINRPDRPTSDLDALRNDLTATEATEKKVVEQLEMLKVEPRIPSRVSLLASAQVPREKNYLPQIKLGGLTALAAFGLMFVGVAFPEIRARRVYRADDVTQGLGVALLGTLPAIPARARHVLPEKGSKRDLQKYTLFTESVDAIRTLLLHTAQTDALRVIMITSANGGEGKTSLAGHLAASLARAWRKTLLVDGDLRNPGAHRLFDVQAEPGLSEVLRGEAELEDVVRPTPISRLWIVPAGQWDTHAIQALAQKDVRTFFDKLKKQYDFIILDSGPVLPVADSLSLAQHVDGVILSVLLDVSRAPAIHAATQRLAALAVRVLGSVVAGTRTEPGGFQFQYPVAASR